MRGRHAEAETLAPGQWLLFSAHEPYDLGMRVTGPLIEADERDWTVVPLDMACSHEEGYGPYFAEPSERT